MDNREIVMLKSAKTLAEWNALFDARQKRDFSKEAANARHEAFGDDPQAIPAGSYCHGPSTQEPQEGTDMPVIRSNTCPFWARVDRGEGEYSGWCAKIKGDDDSSLLWDQCKECGINDDVRIEDLEA